MSENDRVKILREGAPLLLGGAVAKIYDLGTLRTCWPGRWTDPHKKTENERHTTQHAGGVREETMSGGREPVLTRKFAVYKATMTTET